MLLLMQCCASAVFETKTAGCGTADLTFHRLRDLYFMMQ